MTNESSLLERIIADPDLMTGKPCIKGTRLTVEYILGRLADGSSIEDLLDEYEGLTVDDVRACLLFASRSLGDVEFMPLAETH